MVLPLLVACDRPQSALDPGGGTSRHPLCDRPKLVEPVENDARLDLRLPLHVSGLVAVGWWGGSITMPREMAAFASLVFGVFFYWTTRPDFPPAEAPDPDGRWSCAPRRSTSPPGAPPVRRAGRTGRARNRTRGLC